MDIRTQARDTPPRRRRPIEGRRHGPPRGADSQPLAAACLATGLDALAQWHGRRSAVDDSWGDARLAAVLGEAGLEAHPEPRDRLVGPPGSQRLLSAGLHFARPGLAWEEMASRPLGRGWQGVAVAKQRAGYGAVGEDSLEAGPWLLFGDPKELDRAAETWS